jgi:hypothetical protein
VVLESDLGYLEDIDFDLKSPSGTQVALGCIIDKCEAEFDKNADWKKSLVVRNVVDFLDNCVHDCKHFATASGAPAILLKMSGSDYLFFDSNLAVLSEFFKAILPRIDTPIARNKVEAMLLRLESRKNDVQQSHWDAIGDIQRCADPLGMKCEFRFVYPLAEEVDWTRPTAKHYLKNISDNMKMGASFETQDQTHYAIEKMTSSDFVFLNANLRLLNSLLSEIGPILDEMDESSRSWRLTCALDCLRSKSQEESEEKRWRVEAICRKMGRQGSGTSKAVDTEGLTWGMSRLGNDFGASNSDEDSHDEEQIII